MDALVSMLPKESRNAAFNLFEKVGRDKRKLLFSLIQENQENIGGDAGSSSGLQRTEPSEVLNEARKDFAAAIVEAEAEPALAAPELHVLPMVPAAVLRASIIDEVEQPGQDSDVILDESKSVDGEDAAKKNLESLKEMKQRKEDRLIEQQV